MSYYFNSTDEFCVYFQEHVDSTMQDYGIMLVTTEERDLAKKYDVSSFPALGLFRNTEYVPFDGDLNDEMRILVRADFNRPQPKSFVQIKQFRNGSQTRKPFLYLIELKRSTQIC